LHFLLFTLHSKNMKTPSLGTLGGLKLNAEPSTQICTGVVALILALLGNIVFGLSIIEAVLGAIVATALFWLSEFWHQHGHASAAGMVGYPMTGVTFLGIRSVTLPKQWANLAAQHPHLPRLGQADHQPHLVGRHVHLHVPDQRHERRNSTHHSIFVLS